MNWPFRLCLFGTLYSTSGITAKKTKIQFFFLLNFYLTHVHFWGHWYPCFGLLVTSPLGFKARVGSLIHTWQRQKCYMFTEIHLWCDTYCQPAWQLSQFDPHTSTRMYKVLWGHWYPCFVCNGVCNIHSWWLNMSTVNNSREDSMAGRGGGGQTLNLCGYQWSCRKVLLFSGMSVCS